MSLNVAEGNFEYVIWSNEYLDWADWQEAFDGEFDHCSEEEKFRLMNNLNNDYLVDDRREMDVCVGSPIIIIADIGKWDGRHTGYRILDSGNLKDCLYTELDGVTWYSPSSLTAVFYLYARQRSYAHADRVSLRCLCFTRRVLFRGRIVCAFLLRHDPRDRCHRKVHRRISCRQVIQLCLRRHPLTRAKEIIVCMT